MLQIDLSNQTALVTGASGKLGRTIARTLALCGADVAVHYLNDHVGAERVQRDVIALGRHSEVFQADIASPDAVQELKAAVERNLAKPSIVVANAVEQIFPWRSVLTESIEDYESQFRSCVLQSVLLAKAFIPAMQKRGYGRFIGINTECTMQMLETQSAYVAGKRGMDGVLRVLAREVGRDGVTVNQVAPGWLVAESEQSAPPDDRAYAAQVPLRRRGKAEEVAQVVAFLASDLASYVHGAFVPVTGGNVMPTV